MKAKHVRPGLEKRALVVRLRRIKGQVEAIEKMVERLAEDHATARKLALGIASIKGMSIDASQVQTNIVMFEPPETMEAPAFIKLLQGNGVLFTYPGGHRVRATTHRMVDSADIDEALTRIERAVANAV